MALLFHKVFTPDYLKKAITKAPITSATETEIKIGADNLESEVIFREKILDNITAENITVKINAAFEYNNPTEMYIVVSGQEKGVGFKLNDPSSYGTVPYQGIHGDAYRGAFEPGTPTSRTEPVTSRRWPQQFQIIIKPTPASDDAPWGMCYTALDGGHSYSAIYPYGIKKI